MRLEAVAGGITHKALQKTHIKSIAIFIHNNDRVEVAKGWLTKKASDVDMARLKSGM
jgi:hypothetical protein